MDNILQNSNKNEQTTAQGYSIRLPDEIVQLVRGGGGQIQEVHVTDDDGNVQEIAYTYATTTNSEGIQTLVELPATGSTKEDDPSFEYYDNARGKINLNILNKLVSKHQAEDANLNKTANLARWSHITTEYNELTHQSKSRSILMKRWMAAMSKPKATSKSKDLKKEEAIEDNEQDNVKRSVLIKQLKAYDALKIEAAQFERDARKLEMENAALENESLAKENAILDIQLEAAKLELAHLKSKIQE